MSRFFGDIRQIAFIVRDIDEAMKYWTTTLGVGPFFIQRNFRFERFVFMGKESPSPAISFAAANSGPLQIELIQPLDKTRSMYLDFLQKNGEGLQHVSSWLTCADYDLRYAALVQQGFTIVQEGRLRKGGPRVAYFATDTIPGGTIFEICDLAEPGTYEALENISRAAKGWKGNKPVREEGQ